MEVLIQGVISKVLDEARHRASEHELQVDPEAPDIDTMVVASLDKLSSLLSRSASKGSGRRSTFPSLMLRWTMPRAWQRIRARARLATMWAASLSLRMGQASSAWGDIDGSDLECCSRHDLKRSLLSRSASKGSGRRSTFPGLMLRWTMPRAWQRIRARARLATMWAASLSLRMGQASSAWGDRDGSDLECCSRHDLKRWALYQMWTC
ncbi:hypothetical protein GOP47_0006551 [Adiantum capillus-veneris]|uniref:Uncharacterized protein n=1 Tax=Adiantum capillus-veneris TaxID=13818 RepID=A0A9D4ZN54_ADICA|nr:hypothetical protein GOP47_0006551 [Adiantum capillus-veneris]